MCFADPMTCASDMACSAPIPRRCPHYLRRAHRVGRTCIDSMARLPINRDASGGTHVRSIGTSPESRRQGSDVDDATLRDAVEFRGPELIRRIRARSRKVRLPAKRRLRKMVHLQSRGPTLANFGPNSAKKGQLRTGLRPSFGLWLEAPEHTHSSCCASLLDSLAPPPLPCARACSQAARALSPGTTAAAVAGQWPDGSPRPAARGQRLSCACRSA